MGNGTICHQPARRTTVIHIRLIRDDRHYRVSTWEAYLVQVRHDVVVLLGSSAGCTWDAASGLGVSGVR